MNESDDPLVPVLAGYLDRELQRHTGRAAARFLEEMSRSAEPHARPRNSRAVRWWGPLIGAIAAALGIIGGVAALHALSKGKSTGHGTMAIVTPATAPTDESVQTVTDTIDVRTLDEGTVVLADRGPARQFRREVIEHVEWFDPAQNKRIQIDIPSEEVVLVAMNTY